MIAALVAILAAPPSVCIDAAVDLHRRGELLQSATVAERCWKDARYERALLIACQARVDLGHHAHAAFDLSLYRRVAVDPSAWDRQVAAALSAEIVAETGTVRFELLPKPDHESIRVSLTYLDSPLPELDTTLEALDAVDALPALRLDHGRWRITFWRPGHEPVEAKLVVQPRATTSLLVRTLPLAVPVAVQLPVEPTTLELGPRRALRRGIALRIRPADDPSAPARDHTTHDPAVTLHLPPGRWYLVARAPGFAAVHATLTAGASAALHLVREP
jgi:hypothetical protein